MSKDEKAKLSSHESWNKIIGEVAARADQTMEGNKSALETLGASKLGLEELVNNRRELGDKLKESFKTALDNPNFVKNLDPKTVELFKQNSDRLADHILNTAEDSRAVSGKTDVKDMTDRLKHSVTQFKADAEVHTNNDKKLNWLKVADFCKSIKMDKLAEFCHNMHVEGLAREVSKELKVDLAKHTSKTSPDLPHKVPPHNDHGR